MPLNEVWVVETGDYEQRGIFGIYTSREMAIECIKSAYGPPYKVTWETADDGLVGHFKKVIDYSVKHDADFSIERHELDAIK